jgi:hypothetical protein
MVNREQAAQARQAADNALAYTKAGDARGLVVEIDNLAAIGPDAVAAALGAWSRLALAVFTLGQLRTAPVEAGTMRVAELAAGRDRDAVEAIVTGVWADRDALTALCVECAALAAEAATHPGRGGGPR